jgi:hypothetical protein
VDVIDNGRELADVRAVGCYHYHEMRNGFAILAPSSDILNDIEYVCQPLFLTIDVDLSAGAH